MSIRQSGRSWCLLWFTNIILPMTLFLSACYSPVSAFTPAGGWVVPLVPREAMFTTTLGPRLSDTRLYALFGSRKDNNNKDNPLYSHNFTSTYALGERPLNGAAGTMGLSRSAPPPPAFREGSQNPSGIGGQGGITYNVNALKRNLLQETVRAYKMELLALLQSPSATEEVIAEKLAALVQASPVRTTTDSNLLEAGGVRWTLCYESKHTTVARLKQPYQPLARNSNNDKSRSVATPAMRRTGGKEFSFTRAAQRSFHLELVADNEDPHVIDRESYWGGLIRCKRTYAIKSLTRTALKLQLESNERRVLGHRQRYQPPSTLSRSPNVIDMTIIYCDTDLCIIADPQQRTYQVYTQADAWESTQLGRKIRFLVASVWNRLTNFGGDGNSNSRQQRNDRIIREVQTHQDLLDEESRLIVWQLGAGDDDDEAWESQKDPFVHLSADERQKILKAMNVRQVRTMGQEYESYQKRRQLLNFSWLRWPRRNRFQKPKNLKRSRGRKNNFRGPAP